MLRYGMLYKLALIFSLIYLVPATNKDGSAQLKIGIFADCQYCDCETQGNRYYKNSLQKLSNCIENFNTDTLDFIVGLGDLIDRDFSSFEKVNEILQKSKHPVYQVTGNHDYSVSTNDLDAVPSALGLTRTYYTQTVNNWQFVFLNGNELSLQSTNPDLRTEAEKILAELTEKNQPNNKDWNGGLGKQQMEWLDNQLRDAALKKQSTILFCHYPLLPHEAHTLWDSDQVLRIISKYKGVKAWINGHNHAGNYVEKDGVHFITMKGMVDTESGNAYATLTLSNKKIILKGFHRESDRMLELKQ